MDDINLLQLHFYSIRALFRASVDSRAGIEMDSESVRNLDDMLAGFQALLRNFIQELEVLRFTEGNRISDMAPSQNSVSVGLEQLVALMKPFYGSGEVVLQGETYDAIVNGLSGLQETAARDQLQLEAFRGLEAARFASGVIEEVATTAAGDLELDPKGKVLRPDFGGRS